MFYVCYVLVHCWFVDGTLLFIPLESGGIIDHLLCQLINIHSKSYAQTHNYEEFCTWHNDVIGI